MEEAAQSPVAADDLIERVMAVARRRLGLDLTLLPEREAGSFIGAPVGAAGGGPCRVVCCVGRDPAVPLEQSEYHALEMVAAVVAEVEAAEGPAQRRARAITARVTAAIRSRRMAIVQQPVADILTGAVVGVEALCRFEDLPERPEVWFAEAASVGLGVELELACVERALATLPDLDPSMYMSLNASPATLHDGRLQRMLAAFQPERLVIEITESASIAELEALAQVLSSYRRLGVRVALDHVGAGFSSFTHVQILEPDFVKIDRSVVKGVHRDIARQSLARAIVEVAHGVGAIAVAEGVEKQRELDMLATLGVQHAQGFLLAEPRPLPTVARVARRGTADTTHDQVALAEAERDLANRRFELAMTHSPHGMLIIGLDGSFMHVNPAMEEMSGYSERALAEMDHLELVHPDDRDVDAQLIEECFSGERSSFRLEKRYIRADGRTVWGDVSVVLIRSEDGQPLYFIAQLQDTTERKERENQLLEQAETDQLTGAANRAAMLARLRRLVAEDRSFGVLYCDLIGFKQVNDTFGHRAGDHVLMAVADRLENVTRDHDVVARWGGDEFVVVVLDSSPFGLEPLAERASAAVAQPITFHPGDSTTTPGVSIGTAWYDPSAGDTLEDVLHRADTQMYRSRGNDVDTERPRTPNL